MRLPARPFQCFPTVCPGHSPELGISQDTASNRFCSFDWYKVAKTCPAPL